METALLMGTLVFQMHAPVDMLIGALGGMTVAAFVASLCRGSAIGSIWAVLPVTACF